MDTPITDNMRRMMKIALNGAREAKGWIFIGTTEGLECIRIGDEWFELDTQEFGDFSAMVEQLETLNMVASLLKRPGWIITPLGYDDIASEDSSLQPIRT